MLSERVFGDTPVRFFAILSGRYGRQYVDALDTIDEMQRQRHGEGLSRQELVDALQGVLAVSVLPADEEEEAVKITPAEMLRTMIDCGWLEEPRRTDYQRVYYLDSRAEMMLESFRRMAYPEKVTFTDKLHLACVRLTDPSAFVEHPLADLESCLENLRYGLQELRSLQQGMARLTQRQLGAETLKANLSVLYDDFSENIGQRCYRQLVALKLPLRLPLVKEHLAEIEASPAVIARMEAELAERRRDLSAEEISKSVSLSLREVYDLVESIEPQAEAVDRRTADFARRSFARFRYLQEVSSGRRSEVRTLFERVNELCEGGKISDLPENLELPDLSLPSVGLLSGLESLYLPRRTHRKTQQSPLDDFVIEVDEDLAVDEMSETINSALTVLRANRFFQSLDVPEKGLSAADLPTEGEEWLLDVAGLLLHTDVADRDYAVVSPRESGEDPQAHELAEHRVDHFEVFPKD